VIECTQSGLVLQVTVVAAIWGPLLLKVWVMLHLGWRKVVLHGYVLTFETYAWRQHIAD